MSEKTLGIIGPGRVGTALGVLAARAGWDVLAAGRDPQRAQRAADRIGSRCQAVSAVQAAGAASLCLLTVPDDAIHAVCDDLSQAGAFRPASTVGHCSGALPAETLASARWCGAMVASMHPLQTFPDVEAAIRALPGTFTFCEGDEKAVATIEEFVAAIGGRPRLIEPSGKALYHAAAVVACNYLSALMDASLALAERAGIDRQTAWEALEPMVRTTVDNIARSGPTAALTGPIARGDAQTVARHLDAFGELPDELAGFYRAAGRWTVDLARRKGTLDLQDARRLRQILEES